MRDDDDGVLAAVMDFNFSFGEALLVPLAKRAHHVIAVSAVPIAGLEPSPGNGGIEQSFQRLEVPMTPGFETVTSDCPKVVSHLARGYLGRPVRKGQYGPATMRLLVARCEVTYTGRLTAHLPEATRLLVLKTDGSVLVHDDTGGYKPLNWMTPPTVVEENDQQIVVRKRAGKTEDRLEIRLAEVLGDVTHDMGESAALQKDGVERHLQEELAARPGALGQDLQLVRREWPTDIGPVDLMCKDEHGNWVAVEIKRIATIDAVEQLGRYLERIELDGCRGILAAQSIKPQARTLAESRGITCVEVDLAVLRGEREPDLTLFG